MTAGAAAGPGTPWSLLKIFAIGAAMALFLVSVIGSAAVTVLVAVGGNSLTVMRVVDPALTSTHRLATDMSEQESAVLGFGATGDPAFRAQFGATADGQEAALATLGTAVDRGAPIGPELAALRQARQRWLTEYAQPVLAGAQDAPAPQAGQALFADMESTSNALVGRLEQHRNDLNGRTVPAFWWGIGAAVAVVLAIPFWMWFAGFGLRRLVLRPVRRLMGQVRRVASGEIHRPVQGLGPAEFVQLGVDVEEMRRHIVRDLEEARELSGRLDDQARDLSRSNRDLEQFAYVASHDLQEPLRKVSSFCQLLQRRYQGKLDDRADQYIEFAVDGAQRMQRLINDLLAFSRVGRNTSAFETVDLTEVAAAAAAELDAVRREADGEVVIGELPTVEGDPSLLQALLVNLIGNGIKFRREGEPPVVRLSARRAGDMWEISVSDNGIGISPEYAEKVFVIFQRLHARDKYAGTGIGLALAKKIVEFHAGSIGLASSSGPGTTIRFALPVVSAGTPENQEADDQHAVGRGRS